MLNNNGVAGGIIRDHNGKVVVGFCANLGSLTSNEAEAKALLIGLKLASAHNIFLFEIALNSLLVVHCMQDKCGFPWHLAYILRDCLDLIDSRTVVSHTIREAN